MLLGYMYFLAVVNEGVHLSHMRRPMQCCSTATRVATQPAQTSSIHLLKNRMFKSNDEPDHCAFV